MSDRFMIQNAETFLEMKQNLAILKSIENERNKSKENQSVEESDNDSDSSISIKDSSSEEKAALVNSLTARVSQKKNPKSQKALFNKKNAKNFKKYQKPGMPKSFQHRNRQLIKQKKKTILYLEIK